MTETQERQLADALDQAAEFGDALRAPVWLYADGRALAAIQADGPDLTLAIAARDGQDGLHSAIHAAGSPGQIRGRIEAERPPDQGFSGSRRPCRLRRLPVR